MVTIFTFPKFATTFATETTKPADVTTLLAEDATVSHIESLDFLKQFYDYDVRGQVGERYTFPAGTYKIAYATTVPGTLGFFSGNGYDGYSWHIDSPGGEMTQTFVLTMEQWYFIPDNLSATYNYSFTIYD